MHVSRETRERLEVFRAEFARWAPRINLTSGSEQGRLGERHIEDSLQLIDIRHPKGRWFDIGTGGGFPGAILAAAQADHDGRIAMVESNNKKAAFLRSTILAMNADATIHAERAETVVSREAPPETVSARALASLDDLLIMLEPWLANGTVGLFPKGRRADEEIAAARNRWRFDCRRHPSRTANDAVVLEIADLARA